MRVLIIEDEDHARQYLKYLFTQSRVDIEVMGEVPSVKAALEFLDANDSPELIFMDIHLEDGISFEIFNHKEIKVPVIFTTAYDAYAIKAFDYLSVAYLLKPIAQEDFNAAMDKITVLQDVMISSSRNVELANWPQAKRKTRFLSKIADKYKNINSTDVHFVESDNSVTFLYTQDGKRYPYHLNLDKILEELGQQEYFKINRSQIVFIQDVQSTRRISNQRMICQLHTGREVSVSRNRVGDFLSWLNS